MQPSKRTRKGGIVGKRATALVESFLGGDTIASLAEAHEVDLEAVLVALGRFGAPAEWLGTLFETLAILWPKSDPQRSRKLTGPRLSRWRRKERGLLKTWTECRKHRGMDPRRDARRAEAHSAREARSLALD